MDPLPSHASQAPQPALSLSRTARQAFSELGQDFLCEFLEVDLARHPENVDALAELGQVYTRLGRWSDGLVVDRRLVDLLPENPTAHYNLGCSLALLGQIEEALSSLERSVELGYDDPQFMQQDEDLVRLRSEPRFLALLERLRAHNS